MEKAQGSLEYLLILAAILAIAVVVVVIANAMLNPAIEAGDAGTDKYQCGLQQIALESYTERVTDFDEADTLIVTYGTNEDIECEFYDLDAITKDKYKVESTCTIGGTQKFKITVATATDAIATGTWDHDDSGTADYDYSALSTSDVFCSVAGI